MPGITNGQNVHVLSSGLFFHHFSLNSSKFKLKLFPKLKHFFGKLKVSEILKLEFKFFSELNLHSASNITFTGLKIHYLDEILVKIRFNLFG